MGSKGKAVEIKDFDERADILELFAAEPLQTIALSQASSRFRAEEDGTGSGHTGQPGCQVGNGATGRERPPCPSHTLETGRSDQGNAGIQAHMHREWLRGILGVERYGGF